MASPFFTLQTIFALCADTHESWPSKESRANSKLSDEMFSRIRLIKVSDQLQAGVRARQTG